MSPETLIKPQRGTAEAPLRIEQVMFYGPEKARDIIETEMSPFGDTQASFADSIDTTEKVDAVFDAIQNGKEDGIRNADVVASLVKHRSWGEGDLSEIDNHLIDKALEALKQTNTRLAEEKKKSEKANERTYFTGRRKVNLVKTTLGIAEKMASVDTGSAEKFMDLAVEVGELEPKQDKESSLPSSGVAYESRQSVAIGELKIAGIVAQKDPNLGEKYTKRAIARFKEDLKAKSFDEAHPHKLCLTILSAMKTAPQSHETGKLHYKVLKFLAKRDLPSTSKYSTAGYYMGRNDALMIAKIIRDNAKEEDAVMKDRADHLEKYATTRTQKVLARIGRLAGISK